MYFCLKNPQQQYKLAKLPKGIVVTVVNGHAAGTRAINVGFNKKAKKNWLMPIVQNGYLKTQRLFPANCIVTIEPSIIVIPDFLSEGDVIVYKGFAYQVLEVAKKTFYTRDNEYDVTVLNADHEISTHDDAVTAFEKLSPCTLTFTNSSMSQDVQMRESIFFNKLIIKLQQRGIAE